MLRDVACFDLTKFISHKSFSNNAPRSAADLDIKIDQVTTTTQHTSHGLEVLFLSSSEIGHRKVDGRATRFRRDLYIRPGCAHSRRVNERSNSPAMDNGSD